MRKIGEVSSKFIEMFDLDIPENTEILMNPARFTEHVTQRHPNDTQYIADIESIVANPDYIGYRPKDGTLEYIKLYPEGVCVNVKLAVRPDSSGKYIARTLYARSEAKLNELIANNAVQKYQTDKKNALKS